RCADPRRAAAGRRGSSRPRGARACAGTLSRMPREKVTEDELRDHLQTHADWSLHQGALRREFTFEDFVSAFGFMTQAALVAERMTHHREWSNVGTGVHVTLETHDVGGLTADALKLSAAMDTIAAHMP